MNEKQKAAGYSVFQKTIPAFRAHEVTAQVKALSQKAIELGQPGFSLKYGETSVCRVNVNGETLNMEMVPVTLIGGTPKINGWQFVAKVDHGDAQAGEGNLVFGYNPTLIEKSGRKDLVNWLSECPPNCEHCDVKRNRSTTFLFSDETDPTKLIQLGSSCVKDFTGHPNPAALLHAATLFKELIVELDDPEWGMGSGARAHAMLTFPYVVSLAAAIVRKDGGWIPKNDRMGYPNHGATVVSVYNELTSKKPTISIAPGDEEYAKQVVAWLTDDRFLRIPANVNTHSG